ncbi:hypothetical protein [Rhizocola hellebori]|uniref:hypothetical protein n=1 Tax=Rhizocola hellebori TaxID=1392758 RepID=UPI001943BBF4|nr:hypothetical protein [Rhizocola hellebori]
MPSHQESPAQEYWEVDAPPDPTVAQTSTEFLAELEVQLRWSQLSVADIEHRVRAYGGYVPEGSVTATLRGNALPSEDLLVQLLWAVGCDDQTVELWLWARERLEAGGTSFDPTSVLWVPDEQQRYAEGALAQAVQQRSDGGWRGVHRHGTPDDADAKYTPKRLRSKGSARDRDGRTNWSSLVMIGLVALGVLALGAGAIAVFVDGDEVAAPPPGNRQACCAASPAPGSQTPAAPQATEFPLGPGLPSSNVKPTVSTTPKPTTTTQGPQPTVTTPPPPPPRLTGSANTTCTNQEGVWQVTVTLTASLANADSGTDPQGRAGQGSPLNSFGLNGSGSTLFSGQTTFDAGAAPDPLQGTVEWHVTVTVAGVSLDTNGTEGYACGS